MLRVDLFTCYHYSEQYHHLKQYKEIFKELKVSFQVKSVKNLDSLGLLCVKLICLNLLLCLLRLYLIYFFSWYHRLGSKWTQRETLIALIKPIQITVQQDLDIMPATQAQLESLWWTTKPTSRTQITLLPNRQSRGLCDEQWKSEQVFL